MTLPCPEGPLSPVSALPVLTATLSYTWRWQCTVQGMKPAQKSHPSHLASSSTGFVLEVLGVFSRLCQGPACGPREA